MATLDWETANRRSKASRSARNDPSFAQIQAKARVLTYRGFNTFLVSVQEQARRGYDWWPTKKQATVINRILQEETR